MSTPALPGENPAPENPLLDFESLPRFADFRPAHVAPAIEQLLEHARAAMTRATDPGTPASFEAFAVPLDEASERLGYAWGIVSHLNGVADSPELREAYNAMLPKVSQFWSEVGQNRALFERYKAADASERADWTPPRRQAVANALRGFRLGGAELDAPSRERLMQIHERESALSQQFSEHVLDATNAFELIVEDEARLAGLPADAIEAAHAAAQAAGKPGWRFGLQFPSYYPVMQYCADRDLRQRMYRAYSTRASEFGDTALDNSAVMDELLALRREEARLLGFESYAQVSLEPKMAESPAQVEAFLRDLARRSRPFAERDLAEVREFAARELGLDDLQPWDLAWASEKLKEARYSFSDQQVKQYFQLPRVLEGLFGLISRLFAVRIVADADMARQLWHADVQCFRIERDADGALVGQFYLDLYARDSKRPGAWMHDGRSLRRRARGAQTPIAYLTCNFQAPVGARPALLTHDDVITLHHEFGHGLHHLLTRVDEPGVSGIDGVEWDAVELPSQFMENFCWEWELLQAMTAHVDTGEPLPRALFDRMIAARNFQAGLQTLRQIEFALFDMRIHAELPAEGRGVQSILDEVRAEVTVLQPPPWNRFQHSFSHIFGGGYAAGYYSYKWAEVLSADCFAAFEEQGVLEPAVGRRFLEEILSVGGSRPAIDSFRAFRGREPSIDALLRHNGMIEDSVRESSHEAIAPA